jgi:hypothetical protein
MVNEMKAYQDAMAELGKVVHDSSQSIKAAVAKVVETRQILHAAVDGASSTVTSSMVADLAAVPKPS